MFDHQIQKFTQKPLIVVAKIFLKFFNPNQITILGFILGISMSLLIFFHLYFYALLLLILSRLCDGLDGTMARLSKPTALGGYLDIVFDFTVYSSFVLSFGLSDPKNLTVSLILMFLYICTGTTFLARASIQSQLDKINYNSEIKNELPKSIYYTSGLIEGTETIMFMVFCLLLPSFYTYIAAIFCFFCLITFISRIIVCYKELIQ